MRSLSSSQNGDRPSSSRVTWLGWPQKYGGAGLSALEQVILAEEFAIAGVPTGGPNDVFGIQMLGNTLLLMGSEEQREYYLPRVLLVKTHGVRATPSRTPALTSATSD